MVLSTIPAKEGGQNERKAIKSFGLLFRQNRSGIDSQYTIQARPSKKSAADGSRYIALNSVQN